MPLTSLAPSLQSALGNSATSSLETDLSAFLGDLTLSLGKPQTHPSALETAFVTYASTLTG